ncbi:MAG TPA: hypothetical protein VFX48_03190, partial [Saprospiraceae bacterium]|nr:hypothetical protein [Saprospiraceae bacterium]
VYPTGVNPDGSKSAYKQQLESKGAGLLGIRSKLGGHLNVQFWDLFVEGIFNSALLQLDYALPLKSGAQFYAAGQMIRQDALEDGGHEEASKRYFAKDGEAVTFGVRAGLKNRRWDGQLNYNRIGSQGRYLLPREWGRDPFFTFLPRERNEGFGDVHALMGRVQYQSAQKRWTGSLAAGYYDLPDVHDFALNKYAMPGYVQANLDLRYKFGGLMEGLESQLLFVVKRKTEESYGELKNVIHKVDLSLYHVILNYYF